MRTYRRILVSVCPKHGVVNCRCCASRVSLTTSLQCECINALSPMCIENCYNKSYLVASAFAMMPSFTASLCPHTASLSQPTVGTLTFAGLQLASRLSLHSKPIYHQKVQDLSFLMVCWFAIRRQTAEALRSLQDQQRYVLQRFPSLSPRLEH